MGLFKFNWLHRIIRRNTRPIAEDDAWKWKKRLSLAYMLIGWNAFGLVLYLSFTDRADWPSYYGLKTEEEKNKRPGVYFAEILGVKKATILTYRGFTKTKEIEFENLEKKDFYDVIEDMKQPPGEPLPDVTQ